MFAENNTNAPPGVDRQLLESIADGNEIAFGVFFHHFLPRLYPYILKFCKSETAAQDVIQETFIRIWLYRDRITTLENISSWVFKVAANECYSFQRKKLLVDRFSNPIKAEPDPADTVQEWFDSKEVKRLVTEAVDALPAQRQRIYRMSRNQGMSIPVIAKELGISSNTVKNTLVLSLKTIREHLEKAGVHWLLILVSLRENIF